MRVLRREIIGCALLPLAMRSSAAQAGGAGVNAAGEELPNYPRRNQPLANVPPIRRDLAGDRARNLKELEQLAGMVRDLREMVDKTDPAVVSVPLLKKAGEMRKLAQKIEGRLRFDYAK